MCVYIIIIIIIIIIILEWKMVDSYVTNIKGDT